MEIGDPQREIYVEPLELPELLRDPAPAPDSTPDPMHVPAPVRSPA